MSKTINYREHKCNVNQKKPYIHRDAELLLMHSKHQWKPLSQMSISVIMMAIAQLFDYLVQIILVSTEKKTSKLFEGNNINVNS